MVAVEFLLEKIQNLDVVGRLGGRFISRLTGRMGKLTTCWGIEP